jgi:hypothetical protein
MLFVIVFVSVCIIHSSFFISSDRVRTNYHSSSTQSSTISKYTLQRDRCYAIHFQRALTMLTHWLINIGMKANPSKSKIIVFTTIPKQRQVWMKSEQIARQSYWYHNLFLDGFHLSLTHQYEYLGLTLDSQLQWKSHIDKISSRARIASNMVCRLFNSLPHSPHPIAAIRLVKSIVIPTITYGIQFWLLTVPCISTHRDAIDALHSIILRPLRMALNLPMTTHRLGVLVDLGIPSLHDLASLAIKRYQQRYQLNRVLHEPTITHHMQDFNLLYSSNIPASYHPAVIRLLQDAHFKSPFKPKSYLSLKKWATVGVRAEYQVAPHYHILLNWAKTMPALTHIPLIRDHDSQQTTFHFEKNEQLVYLAQLNTFHQWKNQWHIHHPNHKRATTAPLTLVKSYPGMASYLLFIEDPAILRTLARLRHGRAYTMDVRHRFPRQIAPSPSMMTSSSTHCFFPDCLAKSVDDSAIHQLLYCPRHIVARNLFVSQISNHPYGQRIRSVKDLTISIVFGEPPIFPTHKNKVNIVLWYQYLETFIRAIYNALPVTVDYPHPL